MVLQLIEGFINEFDAIGKKSSYKFDLYGPGRVRSLIPGMYN
jgi:hypothetical protein